ncbi:hypothetical protein SAMN05444673_3388 [Bacillus sp. OV166]|uniref:hypothetical protein n=1 Tax=Bacillus sp. OV166 TaxID=1882763 RepID=UPI000A2AC665|nr:hypothetical protein [Bacillus sp. OV166]SMQ78364.1 hypothetical protein SAMN05444673_3388 [Bacillus sp. OV166]
MQKKITTAEKLVYRRATEWLIKNYQSIKLMDPESIYTFENNTNFIQGFVYRSLRSAAAEIVEIDYNWNGIGVHKYITPSALEKYLINKKSSFIKEHVVPKNIYFKEMIYELKKNYPDKEIINNILLKFYFTALITKEEDKKLDEKGLRSVMHANEEWDGENFFIRYGCTGINLIENPYYVFKEDNL